jgi:type II secretory ATPase GspE/PulE/Tfp pilus assembly ATPase PilB-like protein
MGKAARVQVKQAREFVQKLIHRAILNDATGFWFTPIQREVTFEKLGGDEVEGEVPKEIYQEVVALLKVLAGLDPLILSSEDQIGTMEFEDEDGDGTVRLKFVSTLNGNAVIAEDLKR